MRDRPHNDGLKRTSAAWPHWSRANPVLGGVSRMRRIICGLATFLACCSVAGAPAVQDGDIIFHPSKSSQSRAIQRATHSPYSHMGLILYRGGKPYVLEAVSTVRYTPLSDWIRRGTDGHYVVKRLRDAQATLTPAAIDKLRKAAEAFGECRSVLPGQQCCRDHHRHLLAIHGRDKRRSESNLGLAEPYIAANEPVHGTP